MRKGLLSKASLLLATAVMAMSATAAELSPSEALARACQVMPQQSRMRGLSHSGAIDQLKFTQRDSLGQVALYVFGAETGNPGFILASADDRAPALLGYSEDTSFDPSNIPPAMQWWLSEYAAQIASISDTGTSRAKASNLPVLPKDVKLAITPICKTTWNQSAPYYNQTPTVSGTHCVTGCVATAQAQVMKVHKWPKEVTGTFTVSYTVNGTSTSATLEYGDYDWSNMLDAYVSGSYTDTQAAAVAKLMYHVGAGCQMSYRTSASGANAARAGVSLINYFNYDKGTAYYQRAWFTDDEWMDMIYSELQAGRPVMYGGGNDSSAHEFVCDGYSYDNYFHINWGWGGSSDGYFLLKGLDPSSQGIGGSDSGYNDDQDVIIGIQPPVDGSIQHYVLALGDLYTTQTTYTVSGSNSIYFYGGWFNYTLASSVSVLLGLMVEEEDGTLVKLISRSSTLDFSLYGGYNLSFNTTYFPKGTYRVYPSYQDADGTWRHLYHPVGTPGYLIITNDGTTITITDPDGATSTIFSASATYNSCTPATSSDGSNVYAGHDYTYNCTLTTNKPFSGRVRFTLNTLSGSYYYAKATSDSKEVEINDINGGSYTGDWTISLSSSLSTGTYYGMLYYEYGGEWENVSEYITVNVQANPDGTTSGTAVVTGLTADGTSVSTSYYSPTTVSLNHPKLSLTLKCTSGTWQDVPRLRLLKYSDDGSSYTTVGYLNMESVTIKEGESVTVNYDLSMLSMCNTTNVYAIIPYGENAGQLKDTNGWIWYYVKFTETPEAVVAGVEFDNDISEGLVWYDPAYVYINNPNIKVILYCQSTSWTSDMYCVFADLDGTVVGQSQTSEVTMTNGTNGIYTVGSITAVGSGDSSSALRPKEIKTSSTIYQFYPYASTYGTALDAVRYVIFTPTTGVDGIAAPEEVAAIFPNPADDVVNVTGIAGKATVEIYSLAGSLMKRVEIDGATTVDVASLPAGQYVMRIATAAGVTTHKLLKR